MGKLKLSRPPQLEPKSPQDFKDWLEENFYFHTCAYCGVGQDSLVVEHYEPKKYSQKNYLNPYNLLQACNVCNRIGNGKSDYHPLHSARIRMKDENSGFSVIHPEKNDYAQLFNLDRITGKISPGSHSNLKLIANKNIVLMRLDREFLNKARFTLINLLEMTELLHSHINIGKKQKEKRRAYDKAVLQISRSMVFFHLFDIVPSSIILDDIARLHQIAVSIPKIPSTKSKSKIYAILLNFFRDLLK
ncbi:MAG: hypothetical protein EOO18_11360 [Chryseobacterium sp.]|nr:MAG: hypothetical protein EOO18_11360 [Chryseobacterium sp.]